MGFWGVILIVAVVTIVLRLLRSLFEWVDYVAYGIAIIVPIIVWIKNGFCAAVLAYFITPIADEKGVYARCKRCGDTRRYNY